MKIESSVVKYSFEISGDELKSLNTLAQSYIDLNSPLENIAEVPEYKLAALSTARTLAHETRRILNKG